MDGKKKILFYGAGEHAAMIFRHAKRKSEPYGEPTAFIDRDIYKRGHDLFGLPVISWEDAQKQYGDDFYIYVTANEKVTPQVLGFLQNSGIKPERIINYEPVEMRLGCGIAETFLSLRALGDTINYCTCNRAADNLKFQSLVNEYVINHTLAAQLNVVQNAIKFTQDTAQKIADGDVERLHSNCINKRKEYYFKSRKLRTLDFAGVGPCNFKCSYCMYKHSDFKAITFQQYEVFIDILQQLENNHFIDPDKTIIKMSNAEFSINEAGNRLAELVGKYPVTIFTNAYIFSPQAAKAIENSGMIFCSVDAGTQKTFHKVKGVDGFERVSDNLKKYSEYGPVSLKYILLEGENDTDEDLEGFFHLADKVAVRVDLTCDFMDGSIRFSDNTLRFAARFIKHFREQGKLNMSMQAFVRSGEGDRLNKMLEEL